MLNGHHLLNNIIAWFKEENIVIILYCYNYHDKRAISMPKLSMMCSSKWWWMTDCWQVTPARIQPIVKDSWYAAYSATCNALWLLGHFYNETGCFDSVELTCVFLSSIVKVTDEQPCLVQPLCTLSDISDVIDHNCTSYM